jgi:hypothetical protein
MTDHGLFTGEVPLNGSAPPPPTAIFTTDAGPLRSFALGPVGTYYVAVAPGDTILAVTPDAGSETVVEDAGDPLSMATTFLPTIVYFASSDPSGASVMRTTPDGAAPFARLDAGSQPCGLTAGTEFLAWTSASGTFIVPWKGGARQQLTSAYDFQAVEASGWAIVAESAGRSDIAIFALGAPLAATPLVPGARAHALVLDPSGSLYFAAEGIFQTDTSGSGPALLAAGAVPDECHVPQMALTDHHVLWVDRDTQQLMYVVR